MWLRSPGRSVAVEPSSTNGGLETTAMTKVSRDESNSIGHPIEPLGLEPRVGLSYAIAP